MLFQNLFRIALYLCRTNPKKHVDMKRRISLLCVVVCTLVLTVSCRHEATPDTLGGIYRGKMEVELNVPNLLHEEWTLVNRQAVVDKVDESYVDITFDLNLATGTDSALINVDLNFGTLTARCLVGPTVDGDTPLSGTATVAGKSVPVYGEYDEGVLDITVSLGMVKVEFEGVR